MERQKMMPPAPRDAVRPTTMQVLSQVEAGDTRLARWSMAVAVVAHAVFFVLNWNFLAFGSDIDEVDQKKPPIYVVRLYKFTPPPKTDLPQLIKPRTRSVPIPDPDPDDPEPLVRETDDAVIDVNETDVIIFRPEPPDPPQESIRWDPNTGLSEPKRVGGRDPVYPAMAIKVGKEGVVVLECVIGKDGRVKGVTVLRPVPLGLTEAAVEAVRTWTFEPSRMGGDPVEVLYVLTVNFTLQR